MKKVSRKVGKYELGRTIGEGTFAKVKFARNTETGECVALKVLAKTSILKHKMVDQVLNSFINPWKIFIYEVFAVAKVDMKTNSCLLVTDFYCFQSLSLVKSCFWLLMRLCGWCSLPVFLLLYSSN